MDEQQLYNLVLGYFKETLKSPNAQLQMNSVIEAVDRKAGQIVGENEHGYNLPDKEHELINEIVWDLIIQRIIGITTGGLPWLYVTEWGKKVINSSSPIPYDRENYLANLYKIVPDLDPLVRSYLEESLVCLRGGAYRAGAVMLGVSSERLFILLIESFQIKYPRPSIIGKKYQPFGQIKQKFLNKFNPIRNGLSPELLQDLDVIFDGVYTLIKNSRDDSGHPTGVSVTRDQMFSYLTIFPMYAERLQKLILFYKK